MTTEYESNLPHVVLMSTFGPRPFCNKLCYMRWPGMSSWDPGEPAGWRYGRWCPAAPAYNGSETTCNYCTAPLHGVVESRVAA